MIDPRALSNLILDIADEEGIEVTNLSLNKVLYFVHALYLANTEKPLVRAKIEAWQYGPVFREVYHQFKSFDRSPITERARVLNPETGEFETAESCIEQNEYNKIKSLALPYLRMKPGQLVDLSHQAGGPWHDAWYHDGDVNPGMEITNDSIRAFFSKQQRH